MKKSKTLKVSSVTNFSVWSMLKIIRPVNCVFVFICVISGGVIENVKDFNYTQNFVPLLIAGLSATLISAFGYVINDYFDYKIDIINRPERILPKKELSLKSALLYAISLGFVGISLPFFLENSQTIIIALFCLINLFFYTILLKKIPLIGNIMIAINSGLTFIYGNMSYQTNNFTLNTPIIYLALSAFLFTLIREILKTIEDYEGDKEYFAYTIAVKYGKLFALKIIFVLTILAFLFFTYQIKPFGVIFMLITTTLITFPLFFLIYKIYVKKFNLILVRYGQIFLKLVMVNVLIIYYLTLNL